MAHKTKVFECPEHGEYFADAKDSPCPSCDDAETFDDVYSEEDIKLDHIPDVAECRQLLKQFTKEQFWPNVWHINDHGNADLLSIGYNGAKIVKSWI